MKYYSILYFTTLIVMVIMDSLWIGYLARDFYKNRMGSLLEFHLVPAVLFYIVYSAGIVFFASNNSSVENWQGVALYGALLGFLAYATYDLTNLATLKGWSISLSVVDIAWGAFTTAVAATAGWLVAANFK